MPRRPRDLPKVEVRAVRPIGPLVRDQIFHLGTSSSSFALPLRPRAFALARVAIVSIHALCAVYYYLAGLILLKLPTSTTARLLEFWCVTLPFKFFPAFGRLYYAFAITHALFVVLDVAGVYRRRKRASATWIQRANGNSKLAGYFMRLALWLHVQLFTSKGILGIENPHFDLVFLLREIVETSLQTHQAYQIARLLPRESLLQFYISVLVVSCWTTPLLHRFVANKPLQRLVSRMVDAALDFLACVGVPVVLAASYVRDINPHTLDLHPESYQNVSWLAHAMNEAPLILFGSWIDALSRFLFSVGLISSLRVLRRLLVRRKNRIMLAPPSTSPTVQLPTHAPPSSQILHYIHRVLLIYGAVILTLHVIAHLGPLAPPSCKLSVHPWFTRKPGCAMIEMNCCRNRSAVGSARELHQILETIDHLSLTQIVVRHCRQVEIPSIVSSFSSLAGIMTYNVSIVTWDANAALTQTSHPRIRFGHFVRTDFPNGTLPAGLLAPRFPYRLLDMVFSVTNIDRLPADIHLKWPSDMILDIEKSQLSEFPMVVTKLRPTWLCLDGNRIEIVPVEAFTSGKTQLLMLNGNPIKTLPETVEGSAVELSSIFLAKTDLQELPSWMDAAFFSRANRQVILSGTPACEHPKSEWMDRAICSENMIFVGVYNLESEIRTDETW